MKTTTTATLWTSGILAATTLYHLNRVHNATRSIPTSQIKSRPSIPDSLHQSAAVKIVNPHHHPPVHDSRWITVQLPANLGDEEILARFVKGFFGGHVFSPERKILVAVKREITHFNVIADVPISLHIWSTSALSQQTLPPVHALLFGAFRVVDSYIDVVGGGQSYVDFAFGSDNGGIAGVHRFSVVRDGHGERGQVREGMIDVTLEFSHSGCNPREDKALGPDFLQMMHLWYSILLFREGVTLVLAQR